MSDGFVERTCDICGHSIWRRVASKIRSCLGCLSRGRTHDDIVQPKKTLTAWDVMTGGRAR